MKSVYDSLNEKDKRKYAAIEAKKLGRGGIIYISDILMCDRKTIRKGLNDLRVIEDKTVEMPTRLRKNGAGRKRCIDTLENIDAVFLDTVKENTAGDPMNEDVLWTNLTQKQISVRMKEKGINISVIVVKQLLSKHRYVKRKAQKKVR